MKPVTKQRIIAISVLVLILAYACLSACFHVGLPCIFHTLTGLYCPGCGLGRSVLSLLSGDWKQAFRYNVLLMPCILPGILLLLESFVEVMMGRPYHKILIIRILERSGIFIALILVFFGILRNIFPFLAPVILSN